MGFHCSHIQQRGIKCIYQNRLILGTVDQAFICQIVLHIRAGQLVDTRTHGYAAILDGNLCIRQVQCQRHKYALDILAQCLCDMIRKLNLGQLVVHLDDNAAVVRSFQIKYQFHLSKYRTMIENPYIL